MGRWHVPRTCLESRPQSDDDVPRHETRGNKNSPPSILVVLVLTTVDAEGMCVGSKRARAHSEVVTSPLQRAHLNSAHRPQKAALTPMATSAFKLRKRELDKIKSQLEHGLRRVDTGRQ